MIGFSTIKTLLVSLQLLMLLLFVLPKSPNKKPIVLQGKASYYGEGFDGKKTANGETFSSADFTAAHKYFPFKTYLLITNQKNNLSVTVRVNDRGPFVKSRIIDLSESAARRIGSYLHGLASVKLEVLNVLHRNKEIDSIFSCNDVLDCLGNPEIIKNYSISLWLTKDLIHMLYVANELYLQEDVDKVLIIGQGLYENRTYHLVITGIPNKKSVIKQIDYFEKKGFMNVKLLK